MTSTERPMRFPSAYDREPELFLTTRLFAAQQEARGSEKFEHVEFLARRAYALTGWAGRPIPWDEITQTHRDELFDYARWAIVHVDLLEHHHNAICCRKHGTHATPHRGCILR